MKFGGCLLLLSGWLIVLAAMVMLHTFAQRLSFVLAGIAVEALGLALLTSAYKAQQRSRP